MPKGKMERSLDEAVSLVIQERCCSVTELSRRLGIDRERAATMMDILQWLGVIGEPAGRGKRKILLSQEEWDQMLAEDAA